MIHQTECSVQKRIVCAYHGIGSKPREFYDFNEDFAETDNLAEKVSPDSF